MMSAIAAAVLIRRHRNWLSRGGGLISASSRWLATQSADEPTPLLLVNCPPNRRCLYALTKGGNSSIQLELDSELKIPEIASNWIIGSSQGFLISMPVRSLVPRHIHAINPTTGDRLRIPMSCYLFGRVKACKAILSPSLDTLVLLPSYRTKQVGLADLHIAPAVSPWSLLDLPSHFSLDLHDSIFHKDNLYLADSIHSIATFGSESNSSSFTWENIHVQEDDEWTDKNTLVESPEGDDLYLLVKTTKKHGKEKFRFTVYKLDEGDNKWNNVESIGDLTVFMARNGAVSVYARPPLLKPNCIYYFGDDCRYKRKQNISGIYYLKSKRFKHIGVSSSDDGNFLDPTHSSPILFQPKTCQRPDIALGNIILSLSLSLLLCLLF